MSYYAIDYEFDKQWEHAISTADEPCNTCGWADECPCIYEPHTSDCQLERDMENSR